MKLLPEGFVVMEEGGDRGVGGLEFVLQERAFLGLLGQSLLEVRDGRVAFSLAEWDAYIAAHGG
jgi:hypothetical protein